MSNQLATTAIRAIQNIQAVLEDSSVVSTDLKEYTDHFFAPGIYLRTLFIPAGFILVGARHKHDVLNILLKGTVAMINEYGERVTAQAPLIFTAKPGQKAGFAVTDVWYATVHPNPDNITDTEQLEKEMLEPVRSILEVIS